MTTELPEITATAVIDISTMTATAEVIEPDLRKQWRALANAKENTAEDTIVYFLTRAQLSREPWSEEELYRRLVGAFSPRRQEPKFITLENLLRRHAEQGLNTHFRYSNNHHIADRGRELARDIHMLMREVA